MTRPTDLSSLLAVLRRCDGYDAESSHRAMCAAADAIAALQDDLLDARETLTARFDNRKLAQDRVDEEVVGRVGGYLRTSVNGGMPPRQAKRAMDLVRDMADKSLFADLFARLAIARELGVDPDAPMIPDGDKPRFPGCHWERFRAAAEATLHVGDLCDPKESSPSLRGVQTASWGRCRAISPNGSRSMSSMPWSDA